MDVKNKLYFICVFLVSFWGLRLLTNNDPIIERVDGIPIVRDTNPYTSKLFWGAPQEDRGPEFRRFLAASVKIAIQSNGGYSLGSGTIVYYNELTNEAFVASCGHLWDTNRSADNLIAQPSYGTIIAWYHNDIKLNSPKEYQAQILFHNKSLGYDCSLLKFKPDWVPEYFPIAPVDYPFIPGQHFHSLGCDGGGEVARYDMEFVEFRGNDLIMTRNTPRQGRSGGGLLSNDGLYVGTCWATSDVTGDSGVGFFTPLKSLYTIYTQNGYGWILNVRQMAKQIPIIDMNNSSTKYPSDYIRIPNKNIIPIPLLK